MKVETFTNNNEGDNGDPYGFSSLNSKDVDNSGGVDDFRNDADFIAELNTQALTKQSLGEYELGEYSFTSPKVAEVYDKMHNGELVTSDDIVDIFFEYDPKSDEHGKEFKDFLGSIGYEDGADKLDILLSSTTYNADGTEEKTPYKMSFKQPNSEDYSLVMVYDGKDGGRKFVSVSGSRESGTDVSYRGPIFRDGLNDADVIYKEVE